MGPGSLAIEYLSFLKFQMSIKLLTSTYILITLLFLLRPKVTLY